MTSKVGLGTQASSLKKIITCTVISNEVLNKSINQSIKAYLSSWELNVDRLVGW